MYPDVRYEPMFGIKYRNNQQIEGPKNWYQNWFNSHILPLYNDPNLTAWSHHTPAILLPFSWGNCYKNSSLRPTLAEAADPNWHNYIWNQPDQGNTTYDMITAALDSPMIDNGNGFAKIHLSCGVSATHTPFKGMPQWVKNIAGMTYTVMRTDGSNTFQVWHLNYTHADVRPHVTAFFTALLKRYGNNPGVIGVDFGEYFSEGNAAGQPSSVVRARKEEYWGLIKDVARNAPRDSNCRRVHISVVSPIPDHNTMTPANLVAEQIGFAESDMPIDHPSQDLLQQWLVAARDAGVPIHNQGDSRFSRLGRKGDFTLLQPNPWNFPASNGHAVYDNRQSFQEPMWLRSSGGPLKVHGGYMTIDDHSAMTAPRWQEAVRMFGRGGSHVAQWGYYPADPFPVNPGSNCTGVTKTVDTTDPVDLQYKDSGTFD